MTDKQIIIDGINVSELTGEQLVYMNRYSIAHLFIKLVESLSRTEDDYNKAQEDRVKMWTNNTGLTDKLKRKEQQCNNLYIQLKADEEYYKEEENTLRKIVKNKEERNIELYKENNKLKQTLAEIEEIAEENIRISESEGLNGVYRRRLAKQILQKISEVLNDGQKQS